MFHKQYEDRLAVWSCLRNKLESVEDPYQAVIDFYKDAPYVRLHADPWDKNTWPSPWELVHENQYDDFCTVLGWCYSLQLTDRFKDSKFEIHIGIDRESSDSYYLLFIDSKTVLGWNKTHVDVKRLPKSYKSQTIHVMPPIQ